MTARAPQARTGWPPIFLPVLPPIELRPNRQGGRTHWLARADQVQDAKADFRPVARSWASRYRAFLPVPAPVALRWTFYLPSWRLDVDGFADAVKAWADVLTEPDVGIIEHDGPRIVREVSYRVERQAPDLYGTRLVIERLAR